MCVKWVQQRTEWGGNANNKHEINDSLIMLIKHRYELNNIAIDTQIIHIWRCAQNIIFGPISIKLSEKCPFVIMGPMARSKCTEKGKNQNEKSVFHVAPIWASLAIEATIAHNHFFFFRAGKKYRTKYNENRCHQYTIHSTHMLMHQAFTPFVHHILPS